MYIIVLAASLYLHPPDLSLPETPPPLSSLAAFPSAEMCDRQLAFLAARRTWLDNLRGLYPQPEYADWFSEAVADVEDRRAPWDVLRRARQGCDYGEDYLATPDRQTYTRWKLAELRRLLGARAFSAGQLPGLIDPAFCRPAD